MEQSAVERLQAKSPEEAIIEQISRDFNLAPFMARTQFEQMRKYFEQYFELARDVGHMTFLALSGDNPPGRPIKECRREAVTVTLDSPDDLEALRNGIAALRRSKIQRLTREAQEQGALLTQEDLARLLCTSRSTIKREIARLRAQGVDVPTRGQIKDIGKGISHKGQIVQDWLAGYTYSQIKQRRWHSISSIERYCTDFQRVVRLHEGGLSEADIRISTGLSERLIKEYLLLYEEAGPDNVQALRLLAEPAPETEMPAKIRTGGLVEMKTGADTYAERFTKRSLPELLVHKFLMEYGYDHGPVIARAIVEDILDTIKRCYPENVSPKTVVWLAVRREWKGRRKGIRLSELVPVRLSIATDDEIQLLMQPELRKPLKARRAFNRARFARWCFEAYDQGGVLTLLDLSMLTGMSEHYAGELLREYEAEYGKIVPTRGTVHDLGPSVTHKAEVSALAAE
jgi:biotin operon repressor